MGIDCTVNSGNRGVTGEQLAAILEPVVLYDDDDHLSLTTP